VGPAGIRSDTGFLLGTEVVVSVVIPLYNKARHIKRALDSVLAQTFQDFEVIVVNDGSTDGSEKVVEQYTDPRIRLVHRQRVESWGGHAARNLGVAESHADLIAFLDADDEWLPIHLETILRLVSSYPECGIYATGRVVHKHDGHEMRPKYPDIPTAPWEGVVPSYFRSARKYSLVCCSTAATRESIIESVGRFPTGERYGGDMEMWCRIALRYPVAFSNRDGAITYADADNRVGDDIRGPVYTALFRTLNGALATRDLPPWAPYDHVRAYRDHKLAVAARTGLLNLDGYGAEARKMLKSAWATRRLRGSIVAWYAASFLPRRVVSLLWKALVATGRLIKRALGFPR